MPSVMFRFFHKTAWQESSNFYSDLRNASSSELTKYYCVNCCCSAVTMPIRSSSYATWSTSELLVSVQLPCSFAMRKYSVTWFCDVIARQCSLSSQDPHFGSITILIVSDVCTSTVCWFPVSHSSLSTHMYRSGTSHLA